MAMEPELHRRQKALWAVLTALLLSSPDAPFAAEGSNGDKFSRDPADKEACQGNLNRIFGAIQEYRKQHQDKLPDRLSDLAPKYISDRKILICPYVQRNGGLR